MSRVTRLNPQVTQSDRQALLGNVDNTADVDKPVSTAQAAADTVVANASIAKALVDAKGDLIVATGPDAVARVPLGTTNGQILTVDTSQSSGVSWNIPGSVTPAQELFHDFTKDPNGAIPTPLDSGHSRVLTWNRVASTPTISGGRFINPDTTAVGSGAGASYITAQLANTVTYMTADFDFAATGTTNGQLAVLAAWATSLPAGVIGAIPNSPCHLVMKNNSFEYGVWTGGALTIVGNHFYPTTYTTQTQHVEVTIDKANAKATVIGPDGVKLVFAHSLIGSVTAPYVTAEIYLVDCANDHDTEFQKWSASSLSLSGSNLGTPAPDSVGWTELNASGTPTGSTFLKVDGSNLLSAAVPTAGTPAADSVGFVELNVVGTPTNTTFLKVAANGTLSVATPASSSLPGTTSSGWANVVVDFGADPTGGSDSGPAFRNAAASGRPMWIPAGTFQYNGAGMSGNTLHIEAAGNNQTQIILGSGVYFVDSNLPFYSFWMSGIRMEGGAGAVRQTYSGTNVNDMKVIQDCWFHNYTNACIQNNSTDPGNNGDNPYWKISRNIFWGANFNTTMGVALKGLVDSCVIQDNEFLLNRVHCKIDRGNNCYIRGNDFLRFGGSSGFPRTDIWVVGINPGIVQAANGGSGMVITENKFGNEFLEGADYRILYADEGSGTWWGDRYPIVNANSTNMVRGHMIHNNLLVGNGSGSHALVYSTMPNLQGMMIGPNMLSGISTTQVLRLRTATGFSHTSHVIGPLLSPSINQLSPPAWVIAESGTLSGQPKSL
jgi:hypothetical protein